MEQAPNRRFNLGDAMVMIAAVTPSLVLIRVGVELGLFEVGKLTEEGGSPSALARQLVEFFNVGGGCVLAGLVPEFLILRLYRAQVDARGGYPPRTSRPMAELPFGRALTFLRC